MCTLIQVRKEDGLPSNMCLTCISRLCHTFDFIKTCKEADERLHSVFLQKSELLIKQENEDCYFNTEDFIEDFDCKNGYNIQEEISGSNIVEAEETDMPVVISRETLEKTAAINSVKGKSKKEVYKCGVCLEIFDSANKIAAHYREGKQLGKATYTCPICSKIIYGKCYLDLHMLSHTKEKPFKCELCPVTCETRDNSKKHMLLHTDEKHLCETCGKAFKHLYALTRHRKDHTRYICSYCGEKFQTLATYENHVLTHGKEICDKIIADHKEKERLKCNICERVLEHKPLLEIISCVYMG